MKEGTVKWFNNAKGFGFINPDDQATLDVFAHFTEIQAEGFRGLKHGQRVTFEMVKSTNGFHAHKISIV
ncbi:cold shock domain-containing protein [Vibrio sp. 10N.239.312.D08]|uniref:cold shock domain-containing protein n=1 Tax=Vibrio sp. 10N.239.312.D08 TaxID=3229978 RepID=UPI00354FC779